MKISHFLLTRFNLKPGPKINKGLPFNGLNEKWLIHRFNLFYKYCFPSVLNQSTDNFTWIIFLHKETPKKYLDELENKISQCNKRIILFKGIYNEDAIFIDAINQQINKTKVKIIITSRLDNDDVIQKMFIEIVQNKVAEISNKKYVINFLKGMFLNINDMNYFLLKKYYLNPYLSLVEPFNITFKTVYSFNHRKASNKYRVINISTKIPMFITTVHGMNLLNTINGKPVLFFNLVEDFGISTIKEMNYFIFLKRYILWFFKKVFQIRNKTK